MSADPTLARRYLLGQADEEERDRLEREYFADEGAQEAIARAEDELIEDYLDDALVPDERVRFERVYLASPHRRQRVDTVRRLRAVAPGIAVAANARRRLVQVRAAVLAAAAVVLLGVGASMWIRVSPQRPASSRATAPASPQPAAVAAAPQPASPRVFAFSISPVTLRGGNESPPLVVPPGTDVVALRLEGEVGGGGRGVVRAVGGDEVWQGPASAAGDGAAVVNVPAARLQPDDYIVTLLTAGPGPQERNRYVLRVRAR